MMRKQTTKIKELLFFAGYGIYLATCILATSFFYKYIIGYKINAILGVALLLLILKEATSKKTTKKSILSIFLILILFALSIMSDQGMGYTSVVYLLILSFSARDIDFEKIAKFTIRLSTIAFLIIVTSAYLGIIQNQEVVALKGTVHYLGFRYSLFPATIVTNVTLLIIYLKKNNIKYWELIALFGINTIVFELTVARLNYYTSIFLFIITILLKNDFEILKNRILTFIASFAYCIFLILSFYATIFYSSSNAFTSMLNTLSEGRFALQQKILGIYGLSLIGKRVDWSGNALDAYGNRSTSSYLYADSFYINVGLKYGILILIVLIICLTIGMFLMRRNRDIYGIYIMFFLAIHGVIDDLIQYPYYNAFLLLVGCTIIGAYKSSPYKSIDSKRRVRLKMRM